MKEKIFLIETKKKIKTEDIVGFILRKYYKLNEVEFERGKNDKPYIKNLNIKFSLSNKKNIIAVIFSDKEIGIDIEFLDGKDHIKIADKFFGEEENTYIKSGKDSIDKNKRFLEIWTRKEAVIKKEALNLSYIKKINTMDKKYKIYTFSIENLIISVAV